MTQRGQFGKWTENELQMSVAAYRNGDCGSNECSRVYEIPKASKRRLAVMNLYVNGVKALGRQAALSGDMEQILSDHIIILEKRFLG
jgi:hypothetical protein